MMDEELFIMLNEEVHEECERQTDDSESESEE